MRKKNLEGVYDQLRSEERFRLVLEAAARQDQTEVERLAGTCPRYKYTSVRNDPAFADRIQASRQIAFCVCLMLTQMLAKLMVIRTYRECISILSTSLVNEFDRGFHKGWEAGCEHTWLSAGLTGSFPVEGDDDGGGGGGGDGGDRDDDEDELAEGAQALVTEIQTIWEAFSRFCRVEMGEEPETVLLAWVPPMVGWIEGALNTADAVQVDADLLLEYERALTNAWREFLREA